MTYEIGQRVEVPLYGGWTEAKVVTVTDQHHITLKCSGCTFLMPLSMVRPIPALIQLAEAAE